MKWTSLCAAFLLSITISFSQKKNDEFLKSFGDEACKCIDSINVYDKSRDEIAKEINNCIDKQMDVYQLGSQIMDLDALIKVGQKKKKKKSTTKIEINQNKESETYKNYYFELETYLMNNCPSIRKKIAADDKQRNKSISKNQEAVEWYEKGNREVQAQDFKKAIEYFQKAVRIDSVFSFAWDNLGVTYRKIGDYDNALHAYQKSIEIDSLGVVPWQNIAIVYEYKKDYDKAIESYQKLALFNKDNAEIYYGMGRIYAVFKEDLENGLDNMCKAYNLYTSQKSPYRTDAEQLIGYIYGKMKANGNEKKFEEILKANNITIN